MYRNSYQRGMLTVFYSVGSKPLNLWEVHTQDGFVSRLLDQEIKSMVVDIRGTNVSTTYMVCPKGKAVLGITMPFLVMIVKNLKKYFTFEVTILDETGTRRRFRVANFQSATAIHPMSTVMPIGLSEGWNQIQFNLADFTQRAYKKQFVEVQKIKINANIRLRRIYFAEKLWPEEELPAEYRLYFPMSSKHNIKKAEAKGTATAEEHKTEIVKGMSKVAVKQPSQTNIEKQPSVHAVPVETIKAPEEQPPAAEKPPEETKAAEASPDAVTSTGSAIGDETHGSERTQVEEELANDDATAPEEVPAEVPGEAPAEATAEAPADAPAEAPTAEAAPPAET